MTMKRIIKAMSLLLALAMLAACGVAHKIDVPDDAVQITISQYAHPETARPAPASAARSILGSLRFMTVGSIRLPAFRLFCLPSVVLSAL